MDVFSRMGFLRSFYTPRSSKMTHVRHIHTGVGRNDPGRAPTKYWSARVFCALFLAFTHLFRHIACTIRKAADASERERGLAGMGHGENIKLTKPKKYMRISKMWQETILNACPWHGYSMGGKARAFRIRTAARPGRGRAVRGHGEGRGCRVIYYRFVGFREGARIEKQRRRLLNIRG